MQARQLGVVGVGRMGANIVRRLMRSGIQCVVYDLDPNAVAALVADGAIGATSIEDLVSQLDDPCAVWVMLREGKITSRAITELAKWMKPGSTIIDGGNTYYRDDIRRARRLRRKQIHHLDCGTSGGVHGLLRGFCCMIGGDPDVFNVWEWIFAILSPGIDAAPRTPGLTGLLVPGEQGYLYCGPSGAGHFVKMVHNGIEYGMMAALAEGLAILKGADIGLVSPEQVETPNFYKFRFNIPAIAELWRRGSVIGSWLLDLTAEALHRSPDLEEFDGKVDDSGEGRWCVIAAVDEQVPAPVITESLYSRFFSRKLDYFARRALNAMRDGFGGHIKHMKASAKAD